MSSFDINNIMVITIMLLVDTNPDWGLTAVLTVRLQLVCLGDGTQRCLHNSQYTTAVVNDCINTINHTCID